MLAFDMGKDERAYRQEVGRIAEIGIRAIDDSRGDEMFALSVVMGACDASPWMNRQDDVLRISGPQTLAKAQMEYAVAIAEAPHEVITDPVARHRHFALAVLSIDVMAEMFAISERQGFSAA